MEPIAAAGPRQVFQRSWSAPACTNHRRSMLEHESDVTFHVGRNPDVWRIPAHKKLLSQSNPVFHAMFQGLFSRSHQLGLDGITEEVVAVTDVEGRGFENLLGFLYGERILLRSMSTALSTLQAAHKYMSADLVNICTDYIQRELSTANVLQVFQHAVFYATTCRGSVPPTSQTLESSWPLILLNGCLDYIDKHASDILASEDIEDLDRRCLHLIVERDSLHIVYESQVLDALCRWAHCECRRQQLDVTAENRRLVLGDLLWHVRFLSMSAEEFLVGPLMAQLFTVEEQLALIRYFHNRSGVVDLPPWLIVHLPRLCAGRTSLRSKTTAKVSGGVLDKCPYRKRISKRAKQHGTRFVEKVLYCLSYVFE